MKDIKPALRDEQDVEPCRHCYNCGSEIYNELEATPDYMGDILCNECRIMLGAI